MFLTKATSIAKYNLAEQNYSYFFPDDPPTFVFSPASRRRGRPPKRASISHVSNDYIFNSCELPEQLEYEVDAGFLLVLFSLGMTWETLCNHYCNRLFIFKYKV